LRSELGLFTSGCVLFSLLISQVTTYKTAACRPKHGVALPYKVSTDTTDSRALKASCGLRLP
jgi:hypothetical protein